MSCTERPLPRAFSCRTRSFITKRPRTSVWIGSALALRPCQGEIFERDVAIAFAKRALGPAHAAGQSAAEIRDRGIGWTRAGQYDKAIADFTAYLEKHPEAGDALFFRGPGRQRQPNHEQQHQ